MQTAPSEPAAGHTMHYKGGEEELYDIETDPGQFTDLSVSKIPPAALAEMREMLKASLKETGL